MPRSVSHSATPEIAIPTSACTMRFTRAPPRRGAARFARAVPGACTHPGAAAVNTTRRSPGQRSTARARLLGRRDRRLPRGSGHRVERRLAPPDARRVLERQPRHGRPGLARARPEVRREDDVRESEVSLGYARLVREDVEPAAPTRPSASASARAASSSTPPRAVFTTIAPGLRSAMRSRERRFWVAEVSGTCSDTKSLCVSSSSSETRSAHVTPASRGLAYSTRRSNPRARRANAWPMRPKPTTPTVLPGHLGPEHPRGVDLASSRRRGRSGRPRRRAARRRGAAPSRGRRSRR